ncbi:hypothetical protein [Phenylobacterium koreense]|uniref:Transporter n=1 Tax=Phenylobacterium koreense TaxID=266125 RepID=A0ABV2EJB6_9CAUL
MKHLAILAACTASAFATAADAQETAGSSGLSLTTGLDYSSGSYSADEKTEILVAPFSAAWRNDTVRLTASLPYVRIDGPAGVVLGPDGKPLPGVTGVAGKRSGLGDLSLGGSITLPTLPIGLGIDLTGRAKLPTSDPDKHLGTGEADFTVGADFTYPIGPVAPFLSVNYRMPGDPEGVELRNTYAASVGASMVFGRSIAIVSYDYAQASSPLAKDARELFGAVSTPVTDKVNGTLYGTAGLSEGSADYGVGVMLTLKL